jgi:1-acyl-sn-glycerol-3-phosphate acyltransferase
MKNILRSVWALYCFVAVAMVVIPTSLIILIMSIVLQKHAKKPALFLCDHISCPLIMILCLIRLKIVGQEHVKPKEGYVIISNHYSNMDIFAISASYPVHSTFTFLAKKELGKTPFFGIIARTLAVLVDRKSMTSRKNSYLYMKKVFMDGISICVYAEGTRNKSDDLLLPFHDGAFKLAIDLKAPILVNTIVGMPKINNTKRSLDMCPGMITSYFESPIDTTHLTSEDVPMLKEKVREIMTKRLTENG